MRAVANAVIVLIRLVWEISTHFQKYRKGNGENVEIRDGGYASPEFSAIVTTDTGSLNFRQGPGTGYAAIDVIPNGTQLYITNLQYSAGENLFFGTTEYNGQNGWVSIRQLSILSRDSAVSDPAQEQTTDVYQQVRDVITRYNEMSMHNGCASLYLESVSPDLSELLGYFDFGNGLVQLPVSQVMDCNTIEEAIEQRQEYFSDEILGEYASFISYLKEYDGHLYVGWVASDSNLFYLDTLAITSVDDTQVIATCRREYGGEYYMYRLIFTYNQGHLKLEKKEVIN